MELHKIRSEIINVIQCIRAKGMTSHLDPLPRSKIVKNLSDRVFEFLFRAFDFLGKVDAALTDF